MKSFRGFQHDWGGQATPPPMENICAPLERDTLGCKGPGIGYEGHKGDAQAHVGKAFEQRALPL